MATNCCPDVQYWTCPDCGYGAHIWDEFIQTNNPDVARITTKTHILCWDCGNCGHTFTTSHKAK